MKKYSRQITLNSCENILSSLLDKSDQDGVLEGSAFKDWFRITAGDYPITLIKTLHALCGMGLITLRRSTIDSYLQIAKIQVTDKGFCYEALKEVEATKYQKAVQREVIAIVVAVCSALAAIGTFIQQWICP